MNGNPSASARNGISSVVNNFDDFINFVQCPISHDIRVRDIIIFTLPFLPSSIIPSAAPQQTCSTCSMKITLQCSFCVKETTAQSDRSSSTFLRHIGEPPADYTVTSQKIVLLPVTAARSSDPTHCIVRETNPLGLIMFKETNAAKLL
jgi:hypothetical protein